MTSTSAKRLRRQTSSVLQHCSVFNTFYVLLSSCQIKHLMEVSDTWQCQKLTSLEQFIYTDSLLSLMSLKLTVQMCLTLNILLWLGGYFLPLPQWHAMKRLFPERRTSIISPSSLFKSFYTIWKPLTTTISFSSILSEVNSLSWVQVGNSCVFFSQEHHNKHDWLSPGCPLGNFGVLNHGEQCRDVAFSRFG